MSLQSSILDRLSDPVDSTDVAKDFAGLDIDDKSFVICKYFEDEAQATSYRASLTLSVVVPVKPSGILVIYPSKDKLEGRIIEVLDSDESDEDIIMCDDSEYCVTHSSLEPLLKLIEAWLRRPKNLCQFWLPSQDRRCRNRVAEPQENGKFFCHHHDGLKETRRIITTLQWELKEANARVDVANARADAAEQHVKVSWFTR